MVGEVHNYLTFVVVAYTLGGLTFVGATAWVIWDRRRSLRLLDILNQEQRTEAK